ncbi:MAG: hypothetical protein Ct9H90mP5_07090 [Acidimicrobiaceae bacterium]|nr:MAG: hypothetical protein Ct9H90mP5_07090 [Acidimicrobiaceae bacterium]
MVGGKVNRFIPNPTFDPIARPGCLDDYFRGKVSVTDMRDALGIRVLSDRPEYRNRDAKLDLLTKQNLDGCLLFPYFGCGNGVSSRK